jgi:predicted small lipoprotein YifL
MKRFVLPIGTLALLTQLAGCGSDSPPPADGSNLPSEVQEYEKRRQLEREKKIVPKASPPASKPGPR